MFPLYSRYCIPYDEDAFGVPHCGFPLPGAILGSAAGHPR